MGLGSILSGRRWHILTDEQIQSVESHACKNILSFHLCHEVTRLDIFQDFFLISQLHWPIMFDLNESYLMAMDVVFC